MNEKEHVTAILVKNIESMGNEEPRNLIMLGDTAYEVLYPTARDGFLIKFVDENGNETNPIRVRVYLKL